MEADWSAEIGDDLPRIVAPWDGFVDLRESSAQTGAVQEAAANPALGEALLVLNQSGIVFTSKCDIWPVEPEGIDPFEFEAVGVSIRAAVACYIDVISCEAARFGSFKWHEEWAERIVSQLHAITLPQSRVDLVIREALVYQQNGFGLTLYAAVCAEDDDDIDELFRSALEQLTAITIKTAPPGE